MPSTPPTSGPYGDALTQELYPYVEKQFRGIGQGWARAVYGGSTGGWRALALQVFYPDFFNGAWVFCPDPIDFRAYAWWISTRTRTPSSHRPWKQVPIPMERARMAKSLPIWMTPSASSSSWAPGPFREQFDIWQAVYSPVGADGYPALILDPAPAQSITRWPTIGNNTTTWTHIMQRDWASLGPKLIGKAAFRGGHGSGQLIIWIAPCSWRRNFWNPPRNPAKVPTRRLTFDYGPGMPHGYTGAVPADIRGAANGTSTSG